MEEVKLLQNKWEIFKWNDWAIEQDFELITKGRRSAPIFESNRTVNRDKIFLEEGAKVDMAILNASKGPIYIAANAEVMEGATIRGPFSLGEHSEVKMQSKIYGATTIGAHCKSRGVRLTTPLFLDTLTRRTMAISGQRRNWRMVQPGC